MRNDLSLHRYLADKQLPGRPPPPQVMKVGDDYSQEVVVVFASSGEQVPWAVTYVNCPERYLMRWHKHGPARNQVREDGDFRVIWAEDLW